jgi:hypothetical protein
MKSSFVVVHSNLSGSNARSRHPGHLLSLQRISRWQLLELLTRIFVHDRFRCFASIVGEKSVRGAQEGGREAPAPTSEFNRYPNEEANDKRKNSEKEDQ